MTYMTSCLNICTLPSVLWQVCHSLQMYFTNLFGMKLTKLVAIIYLMFYELGAGLTIYYIVKIKSKQWWSRIPPILISTKQTITSPINSLNITKDNNIIMMLEIQVLAWDRYTNIAGLNRLMGSTHGTSLNKIDVHKGFLMTSGGLLWYR